MKSISPSIHPRLDLRLAAYAAAGVALAAPAMSPSAKADIVYSGPLTLNIPSTTAGIYLNVVTGVSATTPTGSPGWDLNPWGTGNLFLYGSTGGGVLDNLTGGSSVTLADNLPVGTSVTAAFTFGSVAVESTGATAFNLSSSANYAGFRFLNETTGVTDYGWVQFSISTTFIAQPRSIVGYAYDNTGAAIAVGAVPEPGTTAALGLGALALGAVGVRRLRQSKQAVA